MQIGLGLALVVLLLVIPVWIKKKNPWGWYDKVMGRINRKGGVKFKSAIPLLTFMSRKTSNGCEVARNTYINPQFLGTPRNGHTPVHVNNQ